MSISNTLFFLKHNRNFFYLLISILFLSNTLTANDYNLHLRIGSFDPVQENSLQSLTKIKYDLIDPKLESELDLYIVQFKSENRKRGRDAVMQLGGMIIKYLPNHAYIIRLKRARVAKLAVNSSIRWVGTYSNILKLPPEFLVTKDSLPEKPLRFDIVLTDLDSRTQLKKKFKDLDIPVLSLTDNLLWEISLTPNQIDQVISFVEILWMEPTPKIGLDMDNARIQGGANYLGSQLSSDFRLSYTGVGITGHVFEGIDQNHPDFSANQYRNKPIGISNQKSTAHGQATFGIIFGSGSENSLAQGLLPNGQGLFTNFDYAYSADPSIAITGTRYELTKRLIAEHQVMFQTASWGHDLTLHYTARSAEMDKIIFDLNIPITQSQSNNGDRYSRPQAWAKNIISVGGVRHRDNSDPKDDFWAAASTGPAVDGRIKPDLVAYNDKILTTDLVGYNNFGGTSGATPIVAGHLGLALEMWTDALFGNKLPSVGGTRFENRPHFTTIKALLINSAKQYDFDSTNHNLNRMHQGWGFPDLKRLYDKRDKTFVVNNDRILKENETAMYAFQVDSTTQMLKATMTYADPPAVPLAIIHRVNNLDLKVTSPSGRVYWGNAGLVEGTFSLAGGRPDEINTVENVFINSPESGKWVFEVMAHEINEDGNLLTDELDSAFALVISGINFNY